MFWKKNFPIQNLMLAAWCSIKTLQHHLLSIFKKPWNWGQNLTFFSKNLETARHITTNDNQISWHLTALRQQMCSAWHQTISLLWAKTKIVLQKFQFWLLKKAISMSLYHWLQDCFQSLKSQEGKKEFGREELADVWYIFIHLSSWTKLQLMPVLHVHTVELHMLEWTSADQNKYLSKQCTIFSIQRHLPCKATIYGQKLHKPCGL